MDEYNGAAIAVSFRLLRSDYYGNCITVRRASDNATQNIGFVDGELDVASLETFCSGTDGFVTTWYDQSGNGNDATQTTASAQPQIVSSGSVILENGKPTLDFDSTDDSLELSNVSSVKTLVDVTTATGIYLGSNSNYFAHLNNFRLRIPPTNYDFAPKTNNQKVSFFSYDGSTATQSYDGGTESNNSFTNVLSVASIGRFGTVYTGNEIQEIIIYQDDKNDEQSGIENNINDYYNIY